MNTVDLLSTMIVLFRSSFTLGKKPISKGGRGRGSLYVVKNEKVRKK